MINNVIIIAVSVNYNGKFRIRTTRKLSRCKQRFRLVSHRAEREGNVCLAGYPKVEIKNNISYQILNFLPCFFIYETVP